MESGVIIILGQLVRLGLIILLKTVLELRFFTPIFKEQETLILLIWILQTLLH